MPAFHDWACPVCRWTTNQPGTSVMHICKKNDNHETWLVRTDDPHNTAVDLCCDHEGCLAEISGAEMVLYDEASARAYARSIGWTATKKGDYCPEHSMVSA
jgi:hypothetical protein